MSNLFGKSEKTRETLKDKSVLVYDYGLFTELAAALVPKFRKVYYFVPWQDAFPSSEKQKIGMDFKGIERVQNFWEYVDEVDLIVCFDTYASDLVAYLRNAGYRVWGAGTAEELELNRWLMRKKQFEIGLPTQASVRLKSVEDVEIYFEGIRKYVKDQMGYEDEPTIGKMLDSIYGRYDGFNEDYYVGGTQEDLEQEWLDGAKKKFVKSNMRGDIETFYATDYKSSLSKFNSLAEQFGHRYNAKEVEFVIEEKKEGIEPGFDGIQIDGNYLSPTMWGFEIKGGVYVGRIIGYDELPKPIKDVNEKMSELLAEHAPSRCFFSTEFILAKDGKPYLIDPCVRNPAPVGSAIYCNLYQNLDEILYYGAEGEVVAPVMIPYKYAAGVSLDSSWADKHELEIEMEKGVEDFVKFRRAYKKSGKYYAVSGFSSIGAVIAFGNTVDETIQKLTENANKVKAYNLDINLGTLDDVKEEIEKFEKSGFLKKF